MVAREEVHLQPTLWRTCRVLASRRRLQILGHLFREGPCSVKQLAQDLEWADTTTTINLRALNARGLLQARRIGTFVQYDIGADPTIPEAKMLLDVLKPVLCTRQDAADFLIRHFTAFTHPRRILIVATIGKREMGVRQLRERTAISRQALDRHLDKLIARGYLVARGSSFRCARPRHPLPRKLLSLAQRK